MQLLAYSVARDLAAISEVIPKEWRVLIARSRSQVVQLAQDPAIDVAVLHASDPEGVGGKSLACLVHQRFCIPIVLLVPANNEHIDRMLDLARRIPFTPVVELEPGYLQDLGGAVLRAAEQRVALRVFRRIQLVAGVVTDAATASLLEHLFIDPCAFRNLKGNVRLAEVRRLNAELHRMGLKSFKVIRRVARVAHTYQLGRYSRMHLKEIVAFVGAGSVDSLIRDVVKVTGETPNHLFQRETADTLIDQSVRYAFRTGSDGLKSRTSSGKSAYVMRLVNA